MIPGKKIKAKAEIVPCAPEASGKKNITKKTVAIPQTTGNIPADFPIVGIGASAGGLAAFEAFFKGMPAGADPGMAFVLVQHLAPDHKSILTELIQRYTHMKVFEVKDGMEVRPNCVYIIPPNRDMAFFNGALQLVESASPRGPRLTIDYFLRSLAQDQHERAICIVLSGTGCDGTQGLRAIKAEGGMVIAQSPESTEYDGMPRSAIATGLVDYELPPAEMPARLIAYMAYAMDKSKKTISVTRAGTENAFNKIMMLLRACTNHDFSQYKSSTVQRRIKRRMAVHQIETMDAYVRFLQQTPAEVEALFRDLLIGVTNFFRDAEAFKMLEEQVIPKLFNSKPSGSTIRVWSPGCSTGEEAYSLAILLQERLEGSKQNYKIQVFATDIDSRAIAAARIGIYPAFACADVSPDRMKRFFLPEPDGVSFRIHKNIRDMLIFSEQNLIKDPPFSKLDLISCRNLMIYMDGELQKKLIPLFHKALLPEGFLFLGIAETVGDFIDLFSSLDHKLKIYRKKEAFHSTQSTTLDKLLQPLNTADTMMPAAVKMAGPRKLLLRELTEQTLLKHAVPAGALVNARGDILYLHGRTGMYFEPSQGESGVNNIFKMAREGLQRELNKAMQKAATGMEPVRSNGLRVKTNGDFTMVNLTVCPVAAGIATMPLYLVILEQSAHFEPGQATHASVTHAVKTSKITKSLTELYTDADIATLRQELQVKEEHLQTLNEELRSSNEEMQSINEEFQSTNEELETSKEELQSLNEELLTVNAELQAKVSELTRVNNDMNNLLAGTGIGTVFVDFQMRILRFTPTVTRIINLIPGDIGRPVGHIVSNLSGYDNLVADMQAVQDSLIPKEIEVQTRAGVWYMMRILPYRTQENSIEGTVLTFVDIAETKKAQTALMASESGFRQMAECLPQLVWTCRPDGLYDYLSPKWIEFSGAPETKLVGFGWLEYVHPDDRSALMTAWNKVIATGEHFETEFRILHHSGDYRWFETRATALRDANGRIVKWFGMNIDIIGRRH